MRTTTMLVGLGLVLALLAAVWGLASANDEPAADNEALRIETPDADATSPGLPLDDIRDTPLAPAPSTQEPAGGGSTGGPPVANPPISATPSGPDAPVSSTPQVIDPAPPSTSPKPPPSGQLPPGTQLALAPIDDADILVMESFPPQYAVRVLAGLPSGCAQPAGHEVARSGSTIQIRVYNSMPSGMVACTMIYGSYQLNVALGSDFESGREYTIEVNDKRLTLRAQ